MHWHGSECACVCIDHSNPGVPVVPTFPAWRHPRLRTILINKLFIYNYQRRRDVWVWVFLLPKSSCPGCLDHCINILGGGRPF